MELWMLQEVSTLMTGTSWILFNCSQRVKQNRDRLTKVVSSDTLSEDWGYINDNQLFVTPLSLFTHPVSVGDNYLVDAL